MQKFLTALLIVAGLLTASVACAEVKTYAKKQAKLDAERNVLEQIYLYVKAQSSSKNSALTKDEIIAVAAGRMIVRQTKFSVAKVGGVEYSNRLFKMTEQSTAFFGKHSNSPPVERAALYQTARKMNRLVRVQKKSPPQSTGIFLFSRHFY